MMKTLPLCCQLLQEKQESTRKSHYESTSVVLKKLHRAIMVSEPWLPLSKVPFDGLQGWACLRAPTTTMGSLLL